MGSLLNWLPVRSAGRPVFPRRQYRLNPTSILALCSSKPTNNVGSYDLWMDLAIRGKTYRISNWTGTCRFLTAEPF